MTHTNPNLKLSHYITGLNALDLEGYLEARKTYKEPKPAAAEI